jgi:hypothetical protein
MLTTSIKRTRWHRAVLVLLIASISSSACSK